MMYLIPKNIKVKREIFKGYGIKELLFVVIHLIIGYLLSMISSSPMLKLIFFSIPTISSILLTLPLPNGLTVFKIVQKYIKFTYCQKLYKKGSSLK